MQIVKHFGMREFLKDLITARRLSGYMGHVARMDEDRIPKRMLLVGYLSEDLLMVPNEMEG